MNIKTLIIAMVTALFFNSVIAEEIAIPVGAQGASKLSLERPRNGITKSSVEEKFGTPLNKSSAVGEPPISSWEYDQYIVYFEHDRVLHSVLKPDTQQ